jgi:hypothetical protein
MVSGFIRNIFAPNALTELINLAGMLENIFSCGSCWLKSKKTFVVEGFS